MRNNILKIGCLTFFVIFIFSCKKENDTRDYKGKALEMKVVDSLSFKVPQYANVMTSAVMLNEVSKKEELFVLIGNMEKQQAEFHIYDLDTKSIIDTLSIPFSGEGSYPMMHGLTIKDDDNFIMSSFQGTDFYLFDSSLNLKDKYSYKYETKSQSISRLYSNTRWNRTFQIINDELHFSPYAFYNKNDENTRKASLAFKYNFEKRDLINLNFYYPDDYLDSDYYSYTLSRDFNGEKFIYAPEMSHEVWITDINHKNLEVKEVKSDNFKQFTYFKKNPSFEEYNLSVVRNSVYGPMIYDKHRRLYYRFFYPGIDVDKDDQELQLKVENKVQFNIIVLDENFKKLTEIKLPKNTYNFDIFFVSKGGLNLSTNHPANLNFNEDFLTFHTIRFE